MSKIFDEKTGFIFTNKKLHEALKSSKVLGDEEEVEMTPRSGE